jgi:O-antigen ligase
MTVNLKSKFVDLNTDRNRSVSIRTIALAFSLVFIFMSPWEGVVNLPGIGTAAKFVGLAGAAVWVVTVVIRGQFRKPAPFHIAVYLFLLWNMVSAFWSADVNRTVLHLMTWVQLFGLVFIIWDLYTTRTAVLAGLQAYILGAYIAVGSAIADFLAGNAFYTPYQRFSSADETTPDGFGFVLVLGIPVAWYLASSISTNKVGYFFKLLNYAYIPAAFVGIALSGTRTAMIAAIPGMVFGITTLSRVRRSARVLIILLFAAFLFILLPYVETLSSFQRLGTTIDEITAGDLTGRTAIWREGLTSFAAHPLVGVGSNMYRSINSVGKLAHNSFLSVLVEVGLVGFVLFISILAIAFIQAWIQPKWDRRFWFTMLVVWTIGASTLTWEHRKTTWIFLSLLVASAALLSYQDENVPVVQPNEADTPILLNTNRSNLSSGK